MQKVVNLLEQHVQWLVLGLAGLYLLFMVWSYVINPPVTVEMGGKAVTPGNVDEKVYEDKAVLLEGKMRQGGRIPAITVADPVQSFMAALNTPPKRELPTIAVFTPPIGKLEAPPTAGGAVAGTQPPGRPTGDSAPAGVIDRMESLPALAAAVDLKTRRGRSSASWPDPAGQIDPANPGAGAVMKVDTDWVTVRYTVKKDDLVKAFTDAKVPQIFMKTHFVRVDLIRQEQLPTGSWGPETVVKPLKISTLPPWPAASDLQAVAQYNEWARSNQVEIVQPPFYPVSKGDFWGVPGEEENEKAQQQVQFDPTRVFSPAEFDKLTPEQKAQVMEARRARAAEEARQRREQQQNRPQRPGGNPGGLPPAGGEFGPGGGGGRPRGGPGHAADPDRPASNFRQQQPYPPMPGYGPAGGFPPGSFPGGLPSGEFGPGAYQPQQPMNTAANFPIPTTEFDPRSIGDITGWAHDDSVEPGKVYRYRVVYKLKNPIYQTVNVASNPALANQFEIASAPSDWTSPVSVPALTSFFLAGGFDASTARTVKFEIYRYHDGTLHRQSFNAAPGDVIGRKDKAVDFTTGWTVVDIRKDLKNNVDYVIVADANGRLYDRNFRDDRQDPELKKLEAQLSSQASATPGG